MRTKVKDANKDLGSAAKHAGVIQYGVFHDAGYRGLYNLPLRRIKQRKGIGKDDLLDRAGHAELAANYFRITQKVQGEPAAIKTHNQVGTQVRETIRRLGGTMPEDLPPQNLRSQSLRNRTRKNGCQKSSLCGGFTLLPPRPSRLRALFPCSQGRWLRGPSPALARFLFWELRRQTLAQSGMQGRWCLGIVLVFSCLQFGMSSQA